MFPGGLKKDFCILEDEGQEFAKILRSLEQFILTVNSHKQIHETFLAP